MYLEEALIVTLVAATYDFAKSYAGCIFLCYYIRKQLGGIEMDIDGFAKFLEGQQLSPAGIATRKRWLLEVNDYIGKNLDDVVCNEMLYTLIKLQEIDDLAHAPRKNALRKYYNFKNGKEFPRLNKYIQIE